MCGYQLSLVSVYLKKNTNLYYNYNNYNYYIITYLHIIILSQYLYACTLFIDFHA